MTVRDICNCNLVFADKNSSLQEIAELMRKHHVGSVVIAEEINGRLKPEGIITDRDLVIEVIATKVDPEAVTAGDIMSFDLITVNESVEPGECLRRMRKHGIRRMPIVDAIGDLLGMVTMDDLLKLLASDLTSLAKISSLEQKHEYRARISY